MENFYSDLARKQTNLYSDPSLRIHSRPSSQSAEPDRRNLFQAPGKGQSFEDVGSSFGAKVKSKAPARSRKTHRGVHSNDDSDDEMDLLSSQSDDWVTTSAKKGKAVVRTRANEGGTFDAEGNFHEDFRAKKLPNFKKSTTTASVPSSESQSKAPSKPAQSIAGAMRRKKQPEPGSPTRPIVIATDMVAGRPRPKQVRPKAGPSTGRKSPLQDRSSNHLVSLPAAAIARPKPRPIEKSSSERQRFPVSPPANNGTDPESPSTVRPSRKAPAPFPMGNMTPLADKERRRVQPSSSFPDISPLFSPPRHQMKEAFPHISPLSSPARRDEDERPYPPLRPFPLGSPVSTSTKRLSEEVEDKRARNGKKRREDKDRIGDDIHMEPPSVADISQGDNFFFLDPTVDPSTLCPYCDEPLPETPTPHLFALLSSARAKSYKDSRPTNPKGLKAPLSIFISVCQRHRFESVKLPEAKKRGWPQVIDFSKVKRRVESMRERLESIILDGNEDGTAVSDNEDDDIWSVRGPRRQSMFWMDMMKEVKKKGSRAVVGVAGQFASFEKTQPGYYGELGSVIIHQTLYGLFPPSSFNAALIVPLTPTEFIQRILVPEAAVGLILEDYHLDWAKDRHREKAARILSESAAYGVAMFPDADTSGKGKEDEDWAMGVGDEIVRERARARRKELEEEERLEEELWVANEGKRAAEEKSAKEKAKKTNAERGYKGNQRRGKERAKDPVVDATDLVQGGKRRKRTPQNTHLDASPTNSDSDIPIASDASDELIRGIIPKARDHSTNSRTSSRSTIDLCSDSSAKSTSHRRTSKAKVKQKVEAKISQSEQDYSDAQRGITSTRRSRVKSMASLSDEKSANLAYPISPVKPEPQKTRTRVSVEVFSDNEQTPQAGKLRPSSTASSTNSFASITKGLQPLNLARDSPDKASRQTHMSQQTDGTDGDFNQLDSDSGSDSGIRGYLKLKGRKRSVDQRSSRTAGSDDFGWLLSQSPTPEG